jgi:signal transduction histidine kinase
MPRDRRILVVLADRADRALASLILGQAFPEHLIVEIGDAVAFAEALVAGAPAAMVAAVRLAWADGLQLINALRRHHPDSFIVLFDEGLGRVFSSRLPEIDVDRQLERSSAGFLQLPQIIRAGLQRGAASRPQGEEDPAYRQLVAQAPVGLFSAAPDGTLIRTNSAFERLLGRGAGLVGQRLADLFAGAEPALPWPALRTGAGRLEEVVELPGPAGQGQRVGLQVWAVPDAAGRLERLDGMAQEVPAPPAAEPATGLEGQVAARRSRAELEQLSYAVSHDLQEPLHVIARHAQLLRERYGERLDGEGERSLGHLADSAERMQAMIDGLLQCARAGHDQTPFAPVDFGQALEEALGNLRAAIEESETEVRHTLLPTLPGDCAQIVQLFQNLVGNAIKFRGAAPPRVVIGAKERESDWRFAVKDNGIGIDPRFHERIFGMFQRLHTAEEYPGTGVGLALCRRIVEHHGGDIWVHSAPGEGATFFFTIPKQPSPLVQPAV